MNTTFNKAWLGGLLAPIVHWLVELATAYLLNHHAIDVPVPVQEAVFGLVMGGIIFFVPNKPEPAIQPLMRALVLPALLLTLLMLSGCSLAPGGGQVERAAVTVIDAAKADRMAYNDKKAEVLLILPCDITIGAYYRIDNAVKQKALQELCSGKVIGAPQGDLGVGTTAAPLEP